MTKSSETHLVFTNEQREEAAKWEYKIVEPNGHAKVTQEINEAAADGWEVHTFTVVNDQNKVMCSALLSRDATGALNADSQERAALLKAINDNPNANRK